MSRQVVYWPQPVKVEVGPGGAPAAVEGVGVDAVREEWLVEDRWWTPRPLRRRYFELVLADGRNVVVFREPAERAMDGERWHGRGRDPTGGSDATSAGSGRWFLQRA